MASRLRIINYIPELVGLDDAQFADRVEKLKRRLARQTSVPVLVRRAVGTAIAGLETAPDRDDLFEQLLAQGPARVAREALLRVTEVLPPVHSKITCHLLPSGGNRGSGVCFGDDRILVGAPCEGDAASWLRFVIAHEYSHTHRAFGEHDPDTVRKDLVFEGLAMVFAETIVPKPAPYPWDEVTAEQEAEFWAGVDPAANGLEADLQYMSHDAAYETGARIVRAYLGHHGVSIVEAHRLPNDELYWGSGYPFLR